MKNPMREPKLAMLALKKWVFIASNQSDEDFNEESQAWDTFLFYFPQKWV